MSEDVLFWRQGSIGRIVLDRPEALNALTLSMIERLHGCLDEWEHDPGSVLVLESSCAKAFCAGGDIRQIRQNSVDGCHETSIAFFTAEYDLNRRLAELATPLVSIIDGLCMGGGLGLSVHGAFRVLSDRAVMAMPETAIGFFPDVGASYFLSRLPGAIGTYLGLTGYQLDAADAIYAGLGTHRLEDVSTVVEILGAQGGTVDKALRQQSTATALGMPSRLAGNREQIDWCFGAASISDIRSRLIAMGTSWSKGALASMDGSSPQSMDITLSAIMLGKQLSLRQCLALELDIATQIIGTHDFIEGVRAALVDKDKAPQWADPDTNYTPVSLADLYLRAAKVDLPSK